jgi:hypothetical protein
LYCLGFEWALKFEAANVLVRPVAVLKVLYHKGEVLVPSQGEVVVEGYPAAVLGKILLYQFDLDNLPVFVKDIIADC